MYNDDELLEILKNSDLWSNSEDEHQNYDSESEDKIIPVGSPNTEIDSQLNLSLLEHENSKIISCTISTKGCNKLTNVKCQNVTPICVWLHQKNSFLNFHSN